MDNKIRNSILKEIGKVIKTGILLIVCSAVAVGQDRMATLEGHSTMYNGIPISQDATKSAVLNKIISINVQDVPLLEAAKGIAVKAHLKMVYNSKLLAKKNRHVTVGFEQVTVEKALWAVLEGTGLRFTISADKQLVLLEQKKGNSLPQWTTVATQKDISLPPLAMATTQETISGTVTDGQTGETLPGVNILVKDTSTGTSTGSEGTFELTVESLQDTLVVSFVGYQTRQVPINGRTKINIEMQSQVFAGEEMVVVGYGTQERSDLTGSVSSISDEEISGTPYANIEQSLQGKVSGVNVSPYSGEPGASMEVQIRGVGTFGSTDPLYIVDGLPIQGQDMSTINPNNIESVEILKDASAAAIYGARAANGVVLITTKKGQNGDLQVEYNGYVGLQSFTDHIPLLNSVEYAELVNESTEAAGLPYEPAFYPADPSQNENLQHNIDWQDEAFRTAPITNQNLRISGGNEHASYSISGEYFAQEGIMVFNNFQRYSARVNTQFDLNDKLTIGENLGISTTNSLNKRQGNNYSFSYLLGASPTMRIYRPENEGGYAGPNGPETGVNNRGNFIGRRDMRRYWTNQERIFGNAFAQYVLVPNLEYRLNLGINGRWNQDDSFIRTHDMDNRQTREASMSQTKDETYELLLENTLTYTADINEDYHVELLAGYTQQSSTYEYLSGNISQFASNDIRALSAGKGTPSLSGNKSEWALQSFIGRANLRLYNKYLLTSTFRRDGSSRFGETNRWGNFPSFALGWIISEEEFVPNISFVDELKLRGSWGQLGNQEISNYVNQTTATTEIRYTFNDLIVNGTGLTSLGNPQLKWETTTQTDIGVDIEMFNRRLSVHSDYFVKNTEDILLRVPISVVTGIDSNSGPYRNAASMRNSGFEFEMRWREDIGDLFYSLSGNLSAISNRVTSLGGESSIIQYVSDNYPGYGVFVRSISGQPMSHFYGWVADGVFQTPQEVNNHATQAGAQAGDMRFKDLNGDNVVNDSDRKIIGDPWPDFTYGLAANFGYKNFDLSLSIQGVQGKEIYTAQRAFLEHMNGENNQTKTTLDRWQPDDPSGIVPRATRNDPNNNVRASTRFLEDASYLRLNNIEVGYTIPSTLVNKIGLDELRINIRGQNIVTITNYSLYNPGIRGGGGRYGPTNDPLNIGVDTGIYPVPRTFQLGITAGF